MGKKDHDRSIKYKLTDSIKEQEMDDVLKGMCSRASGKYSNFTHKFTPFEINPTFF